VASSVERVRSASYVRSAFFLGLVTWKNLAAEASFSPDEGPLAIWFAETRKTAATQPTMAENCTFPAAATQPVTDGDGVRAEAGSG